MSKHRNTWEYRKLRLAQMGYQSYNDYLRSAHWEDVRKRFYTSKLYKGHCDVCFRKGCSLEIHHKSYKRLGFERLGDLIAVCRGCHQATHDRQFSNPRITLWSAHKKFRRRNLKRLIEQRKFEKKELRKQYKPPVRSGNFIRQDGRLIYQPII